MNTFISMLRGINVGGHAPIHMAELKCLYEAMGLVNVRTYVQSGNVVFKGAVGDAASLAGELETRIAQSFGQTVAVFIRNPKDLQHLIDTNPFLHGRQEDPAKLHVTFLHQQPSRRLVSQLDMRPDGQDEFVIQSQEIFLFCPNGYGKTRFSNGFFERKLNTLATTRNWKTVNALLQMAHGIADE